MGGDIKDLKPTSNKFENGEFKNPKKYNGKYPIWYRSSLEKHFMINLELNPRVKYWASEDIKIPYILEEIVNGKSVKSRHEYNTDFTVEMVDGKKYVVEVKPSSQCPLNNTQILFNPVMQKNADKWRSAINWCKLNGYEFIIRTEKKLNI